MKHDPHAAARGGSITVHADGKVSQERGTLNHGDKGYRDAVRDTPVHDKDLPGTLKRAPSFRDLEEKPEAETPKAKPITTAVALSAPAAASPSSPTGAK